MIGRRSWLVAGLAALGAAGSRAVPAPGRAVLAPLSAQEIVSRNAVARGGVEAWQKIVSMAWAGRAEMGASPLRQLPFLLEQKRPNKMRFEIMAEGLRSVRAFDGNVGWKMKPNPATGKPETQAYTADELAFARGAQVIDGPLMDYAGKGAAITLTGEGEVDGRKAYVLDVKLPVGGGQRVWVDTETFLELRHDRRVHGATGPGSQVTVLFREYRDFEALKLPTVIETSVEPGRPANRLVIEKVALNPELDEMAFAKPPETFSRRRGVVVDARSSAPRADTARP